MLPQVENLVPWPRDNSESTDYFFPWSATTTSSLTCDFETPLKSFRSFLKFLMQQLKRSSSFWRKCWSWQLYVCMKVNTSKSHRRFNTQLSKDSQNIARVFPFILKVKQLTLHVIWTWAKLEILKKIKFHEFRSIESNFQSIETCRFCPITSAINWFQF